MWCIRICFIATAVIGLNGCSRGPDEPRRADVSPVETAPVSPPVTEPAVPPPVTPEKPAVAAKVNPPVAQPPLASAPRPPAKASAAVSSTPAPTQAPDSTSATSTPLTSATSTTTKSATPAPVTTASGPIPIDLAALEKQLKSTKAIGVFSKIALKNQVDDLMKKFRDHYKGKGSTDLAQLRQSYDLLMMKVLSMVQDEDKNLAAAIVSSRAAIWDLLADPVKFAALDA